MPLPPLSRRLVRLGHSLSAQDLDPVQAIVFANGHEGLLTLRVLARMRCTSIPHHRALFTQFRLAFEDEYVPPLVDSSSEDADADDESSESDVSLDIFLHMHEYTVLHHLRPHTYYTDQTFSYLVSTLDIKKDLLQTHPFQQISS